jgi:integrase
LTRKIRIKTPQPLPRAIDPEDIQSLLRVITNLRDRTLILVLLRTGMRIGELLRTKLIDLNFVERRIEIFEAQKNRVGRVVYISDDAFSSLKQWLEQRKRDSEYVFYGHQGRMLTYEAARSRFLRPCPGIQ